MTATTFLPILFPADLAAGVVEGVTAAADVAAAAEAAAGAESVTGTNARAAWLQNERTDTTVADKTATGFG